MGLKEVNQKLDAAKQATDKMGERAASAEAKIGACNKSIAELIQYLRETVRPLLGEALGDRETGIKELRAASEAYGDVQLHLQATKLTDDHPIVESVQVVGEQLEPAKQRILAEVFTSDEDVLEVLQDDVKSNEAGLNDVRLHLGSLIRPDSEVPHLRQQISAVGSAIAAYRK